MANAAIVMFNSAEAATYKTDLKGWVSRDGMYFGENERTARWSGCTHMICACGAVHEKGRTVCRSCEAIKDAKMFLSLPVEKWDGETPTCLFGTDKYFFGESLLDYIADQPSDAEIRICKCKPHYLSEMDTDYWYDDLAEDGEVPDDVLTAMEALNAAIKKAAPACWYEDAIAIDVEDLRAQLLATR